MASKLRLNVFDRPQSRQWWGLIVVAITFVTAAALTWRKWPDTLIDFGLQLYLPWKIYTGSVLYRDVMYLTGGPLSQHYDALLFKLFGVSLLTLVISNLTIAAGLLLLIYRRFLAATDAWTATTICLGVVMVFTFGQYSDIGNFNFITPYCHEVVHGLVISIVTVALLSSWVTKERIGFAAGAGFCAGLVFMTKPDVFAALMICVAVAFVLFWATKRRVDFLFRSLAAFLLAGLVPLVGFLLYFHRVEDWQASLRSVAFAWVPLLGSSVSKDFFYKWCLGLDTPGHNIIAMLKHFVAVAAIVSLCAVLFRRKMDSSANRLVAVAAGAVLVAMASAFDWVDCGRSLPLLSLGLFVILCVKYKELAVERPPVFPLLWSVFGLALLAKLGLYSRIWHYGFALAMPAFVSAIYLLLWLLPRLLEKYGVQPRLFRGTVWLVLMVGFVRLFVQSEFVYQGKTVAVGRGGDAIMAFAEKINPTGTAIQAALPWIEEHLPPGATLAVLPEGAMVNFLSRRTNPTHYFVWNPAEMAVFGQTNMTAAFQQNSPDYVMLIHRDGAEYGVKFFGQEEKFGLELMQWIQQHYESVWLIGHEPLQQSLFGIKILKRVH
ncbi:MAG: hypothetical protein JWR69_1514 [Pedosphaera sp.]|nr:hypothetical protein [Pedosphaera sp.]